MLNLGSFGFRHQDLSDCNLGRIDNCIYEMQNGVFNSHPRFRLAKKTLSPVMILLVGGVPIHTVDRHTLHSPPVIPSERSQTQRPSHCTCC